jgi:hypothetical protein
MLSIGDFTKNKDMKKVLTFSMGLLIVLQFTLPGCSSCTSGNKKNIEEKISFDDVSIEETLEEVYYSLPSPEEMIDYIKSNEVEFNHTLLLNTSYARTNKSYTEKTLLLGAYMADAAYLSVFSKTEYMPNYLIAMKSLADDIGLNTGLTPKDEKIIKELTSNPNSVHIYSKGIYDSIINYIQNYDNGETLSVLFAGAYIESLYIIVKLHPEFYSHKQSIERIVDQKIIIEDIITMMQFADSKSTNDILSYLNDINDTLHKFELTSSITDVIKDKDGTIHIIGNSQVELSDKHYTEFKNKIFKSRNSLIANDK